MASSLRGVLQRSGAANGGSLSTACLYTQQPSSAIGHFVVADSCSEAFRFKSVYILSNPESECVFFFHFPLPAHFAALTY